jgi:hypothetical protein
MEIAAAAGRRIVHRPVDLNRVIAAVGSTAFLERTPAHRNYFFVREMDRWAEIRGAPVMVGRPTHHDKDMTLPNCFLIAGIAAGLDIDRLTHVLLVARSLLVLLPNLDFGLVEVPQQASERSRFPEVHRPVLVRADQRAKRVDVTQALVRIRPPSYEGYQFQGRNHLLDNFRRR